MLVGQEGEADVLVVRGDGDILIWSRRAVLNEHQLRQGAWAWAGQEEGSVRDGGVRRRAAAGGGGSPFSINSRVSRHASLGEEQYVSPEVQWRNSSDLFTTDS